MSNFFPSNHTSQLPSSTTSPSSSSSSSSSDSEPELLLPLNDNNLNPNIINSNFNSNIKRSSNLSEWETQPQIQRNKLTGTGTGTGLLQLQGTEKEKNEKEKNIIDIKIGSGIIGQGRAAIPPRRFTCEECGMAFAKASALSEHVRGSHPTPPPPKATNSFHSLNTELSYRNLN